MTSIAVRGLVSALVLLVAGPGLVLGSAPAAGAATCTTSGGVSVVVDFRELGGSTVTSCAADGGGKSATAIFASVGVDLSYATRQPGFVCRVEGAPASDPCVNASPSNAYWGLWWADGSKASWTYSSSAVGSLTVPAGGSVGWSWQQDRTAGTTVAPGIAPPVTRTPTPTATPSPSPTATPTASPTSSPTATPSGGGSGSTGGSSASPQATPSGSPSAPSESPVASESPGDSTDSEGSGAPSDDPSLEVESPGDSSASSATEAGSPAADEPARVPAAVTWGIVGMLAIAITVSAVVARRRRGSDAP